MIPRQVGSIRYRWRNPDDPKIYERVKFESPEICDDVLTIVQTFTDKLRGYL